MDKNTFISAQPSVPINSSQTSAPYITTSSSLINTSTLEETLHHITPEFPYMTELCAIHNCPGGIFPWHWHREVEIFYIRSGTLDYILPSGCYTFRQGEGGFINSGILHMTCCPKNHTCTQEEHLFLPSFIGGQELSILTSRYITPILEHPSLELYRFDPTCPSHRKVINLMKTAFDCYTAALEGYEFELREYMTKIWMLLFSFTKDLQTQTQKRPRNDRIKTMMAFIASHYQEKLTLKQIADSCFISPRECSRCFQETLGQSPFSYLMDYRLHKACSLLAHTTLTVTQISTACGFASSSYFTQVFRQAFGCTPREYAKSRQY